MSDFVLKLCPQCMLEIAEDDAVHTCESCGTAHHQACWDERSICGNAGCPTHAKPAAPVQAAAHALFCGSCGMSLKETQLFCPRCGAPGPGAAAAAAAEAAAAETPASAETSEPAAEENTAPAQAPEAAEAENAEPAAAEQTAEAAEAYINFLCDPQNCGPNLEYLAYSSPETASKEYMDPAVTESEVAYPDAETLSRGESFYYLDAETTQLMDSLWLGVKTDGDVDYVPIIGISVVFLSVGSFLTARAVRDKRRKANRCKKWRTET